MSTNNDLSPCGSGKKYKWCRREKERQQDLASNENNASILKNKRWGLLALIAALAVVIATVSAYFYRRQTQTLQVWVEDDIAFWKVAGETVADAAKSAALAIHITYFKGGAAFDPDPFLSPAGKIDLVIGSSTTLARLTQASVLREIRLPRNLVAPEAPLRFKDALRKSPSDSPVAMPFFAGRVSWLLINSPYEPVPRLWQQAFVTPEKGAGGAPPPARVGRFLGILPSDRPSLIMNLAYQCSVFRFDTGGDGHPGLVVNWNFDKLSEMLDTLATAAHKQQNFPVDCRGDCFWGAIHHREAHFALAEEWMFYSPAQGLAKRDFKIALPQGGTEVQRQLIQLVGIMPLKKTRAVSAMIEGLLSPPIQRTLWTRYGRIPAWTELSPEEANVLYDNRLAQINKLDLAAWPLEIEEQHLAMEQRLFAIYLDFIEGRFSLELSREMARQAFAPH